MNTDARLDLQEDALDELGALIRWSDKLADIMLAASQMPRQIGIRKASRYLATNVGMHEDDAFKVINAIVNLYHTQKKLTTDSPGMVRIIAENLKRLSEKAKNPPSHTQWEDASNKIVSALSKLSPDHPLEDAYKASVVLSCRQYGLRASKILTELRPIFNDAGTEITQSVISHTLYLHYHDGSNHHEFEVLVDAKELTELKRQCERAERKASIMKNDLKSMRWPTSILREPTEPKETNQ
jgi:hypothetical protein